MKNSCQESAPWFSGLPTLTGKKTGNTAGYSEWHKGRIFSREAVHTAQA